MKMILNRPWSCLMAASTCVVSFCALAWYFNASRFSDSDRGRRLDPILSGEPGETQEDRVKWFVSQRSSGGRPMLDFSSSSHYQAITDAGLRAIDPALIADVRIVNLFGCRFVTNEGVEAVLSGRAVQVCNLSGTAISDDVVGVLCECPYLENVQFDFTAISEAAVERICNCQTRLYLLSLDQLNVSDRCVTAIVRQKRLSVLSLSNTKLSNEGVRQLSQSDLKLTELDLSHCNITDAVVERLGQLVTLSLLDLTYTELSQSGIQRLREMLPDCKIRY